jgi:serine/threonine-protein phosphatase CPPED1
MEVEAMKRSLPWALGLSILVLGSIGCGSDSDSHAATPATFESGIAADEPVPWTSETFANDPAEFRFAVVSDRCGIARPGVFPSAIDDLKLLRPEFVINVGDLIEGYTEDQSELDAMRGEVDATLNTLGMPFFRVVGNHDMGNDIMRQDWLSRYGRDYYSFVYKDTLFLCLSTEDPPVPLPAAMLAQIKWFTAYMQQNPTAAIELAKQYYAGNGDVTPEDPNAADPTEVGNISDVQVSYFKKVIEEHPDVRWTYVFLHKPVWTDERSRPAFDQIVQALGDRPYTVFAGHKHRYAHDVIDGRDYFVLGSTGALMKGEGPDFFDHVVWVAMTNAGPQITNLALAGLLDSDLSGPGEFVVAPSTK